MSNVLFVFSSDRRCEDFLKLLGWPLSQDQAYPLIHLRSAWECSQEGREAEVGRTCWAISGSGE